MSLNCDHIRARLHDRLDDQLDAEGIRQVEEHLAGCDHCRRVAEALHETRTLLGELQPVTAPPGFAADLAAAVRATPQEHAARPRTWKAPGPILASLSMAAGVMILAMIAGPMMSGSRTHDDSQFPLVENAPTLKSTADGALAPGGRSPGLAVGPKADLQGYAAEGSKLAPRTLEDLGARDGAGRRKQQENQDAALDQLEEIQKDSSSRKLAGGSDGLQSKSAKGGWGAGAAAGGADKDARDGLGKMKEEGAGADRESKEFADSAKAEDSPAESEKKQEFRSGGKTPDKGSTAPQPAKKPAPDAPDAEEAEADHDSNDDAKSLLRKEKGRTRSDEPTGEVSPAKRSARPSGGPAAPQGPSGPTTGANPSPTAPTPPPAGAGGTRSATGANTAPEDHTPPAASDDDVILLVANVAPDSPEARRLLAYLGANAVPTPSHALPARRLRDTKNGPEARRLDREAGEVVERLRRLIQSHSETLNDKGGDNDADKDAERGKAAADAQQRANAQRGSTIDARLPAEVWNRLNQGVLQTMGLRGLVQINSENALRAAAMVREIARVAPGASAPPNDPSAPAGPAAPSAPGSGAAAGGRGGGSGTVAQPTGKVVRILVVFEPPATAKPQRK